MYTGMDWWTKVRLEVLRGEKSKREVLREEGIHWETLKKVLKYSQPPEYRLKEPRSKPKIGPYFERIAQIIEQDKSLPKKQRHTAKRIYERIREMGYEGRYTQVKEAVRELMRIKQEVFMPLIHRPGEAQVDFGYALVKVSEVGFSFDSLEEVLGEAQRSAEVTHNSDGGIRGAQAVASGIFFARMGSSKAEMKKYIEQTFGYDLREPLDKMRQYYYRHHDVTCDGSVPQAIIAFLESDDFEDAIRKAISIAGDSDTNACMAGGMAQAFYKGIPKEIEDKVRSILDERLNGVLTEFTSKYCL